MRLLGIAHTKPCIKFDWIGLCSVLRPFQHSIGYMGDGFYRSKDPTNSIKVLKENLAHMPFPISSPLEPNLYL